MKEKTKKMEDLIFSRKVDTKKPFKEYKEDFEKKTLKNYLK